MGNQITNNLSERLDSFLQDVAQGVWGDSRLTYTDISKYSEKATKQDIKVLREIAWAAEDDEDMDIDELEHHIYGVIQGA